MRRDGCGLALVCVVAVVMACVAGCKSAPAPKAEAKAEPQAPKEPLADVVLKVNGEAWKVAGAVVYDQGSSKRYLELSTFEIPCGLYDSAGREIREGEQILNARVASLLQPDGTSVVKVMAVEVGGRLFTDGLTGLTLGERAGAGKEVTFALGQELALPEDDFLNRPALSVSMQGEGRAVDCGTWASSGERAPMPQAGLTVKVAGRAFPIQGALLSRERGGLMLRLTSAASTCDGGAGSSDIDLKIGLTRRPGDDGLAVSMSGDVLKASHSSVQALDAVKVDAKSPLEEAKGDGPVMFGVEAAFKVGDYAVEVRGPVTALNCQ